MHKRRYKGYDYGAVNHPDLESRVESVPEPVEEVPSMEPDRDLMPEEEVREEKPAGEEIIEEEVKEEEPVDHEVE